MKKFILSGIMLLSAYSFSQAQLAATGAIDDFATTTEYTGITWFVDPGSTSQLSEVRSAGKMTVTGVTGANLYAYFGVKFGTFINAITNTNADVQLTIKNAASNTLFMSVILVDTNGVQAQYEPNIADVTPTTTYADNTGAPNYYYHRKALNGFTLAPGVTKTIKIDLSSVMANLGGLSPHDNDGNGTPNDCDGTHPFTCPETAHLINPGAIAQVFFAPNFGSSDIDLSEGDGNPLADTHIAGDTITRFVGNFEISNFKIGTGLATAIDDAVAQATSLSIYPNPAKDLLNVSFDVAGGADVSLANVTGNTLMTASGVSPIQLNTSGLPSGIYILNVVTEKGKVARKVSIQ